MTPGAHAPGRSIVLVNPHALTHTGRVRFHRESGPNRMAACDVRLTGLVPMMRMLAEKIGRPCGKCYRR